MQKNWFTNICNDFHELTPNYDYIISAMASIISLRNDTSVLIFFTDEPYTGKYDIMRLFKQMNS